MEVRFIYVLHCVSRTPADTSFDAIYVVWRIVIGLSLIPAFGTLYQRLTLPESARYLASRKRPEDAETFEALKVVGDEKDHKILESDASDKSPTRDKAEEIVQQKAHFPGKTSFGH
jgi:MFS transporter, PHS family, inorganic phosphate transporter